MRTAARAVKVTMPTLRPGENSRRRQSGFSLLEIFIVLLVMSLVAVLVAPSFTRGFKGLQLETSGRDLVTLMKQARSQAIAKQQVFRVILSKNDMTSSYILANDFGEKIKEYPLPEDISFHLEDEQVLPLTVSFYPNGRSSGGQITLVGGQGKQMPITVDPVTGFGRVISAASDGER